MQIILNIKKEIILTKHPRTLPLEKEDLGFSRPRVPCRMRRALALSLVPHVVGSTEPQEAGGL